jgi:hypothetical protein
MGGGFLPAGWAYFATLRGTVADDQPPGGPTVKTTNANCVRCTTWRAFF